MCEGILTGLIESDEPGHKYSRKGEIVRCPWHGWEFDVRPGSRNREPERIQVRSYPVEVAEGRVVEGPYVAGLRVTVEVQDQCGGRLGCHDGCTAVKGILVETSDPLVAGATSSSSRWSGCPRCL